MTRFAAALLAAALLLVPGCFGGGTGWNQEGVTSAHLDIDIQNCEWDATHQTNEDGSYSIREISDEELDAEVRRCMSAKGYEWGPLED